MFEKTKTHIVMLPKDKDIIIRGEWLTDIHMDHFNHLLKNCSDYRPVETWRIQCLDTIQPVPKDKKHIQILHSSSSLYDGHWVCSYYNTKNICIYDSLNTKKLHKHHEEFLKRLFPTYAFEKYSVKFPTVQHQPNGNDCGVYAIAFAISLLFNIKPEKVKYDHSLMRLHLIKIFEYNVIEHFPQDPQYTFQKVFPLAVIKANEIEAIRKRTIRISPKLHIKNNDCKINSNKNVCNDNEINRITINEQIYRNKNYENKYIQKCFLSGDNNESENNININKRKYDLENQCTNNRLRHMQVLQNNLDKQDLESNHIKQHDLNKQNTEEKRAKERNYYKQNLEDKRAKKRDRYKQNIEEKRAKERNYYKQNLEDKRAKKRDRYKQNLEDKRAKKRDRYKQNIKEKRAKQRNYYRQNFEDKLAKQRNYYKQNLEDERAKHRNYYKQNLEDKLAKQRNYYKQNVEDKRAKQRNYYKLNLEDKRAKQCNRYKQNSKDKCIKERDRYKADLDNKRVEKLIRYSKNFQRERERQRKLNPDRLYNKRYYLKKSTKSISEVKKSTIVQKINKKYEKFWLRNSIKICNSLKIFKVKDIVQKINIKGHIEKQLEAEKIIRWCMHIRNSHIRKIYKMLTLIKKKSEVNLTLEAECSTIDDKLRALCGISKHTASSENYFIDSTYRDITSSEPLIINTKGKVVNILPLIEGQIKKS